jgi:1-aminocyclopropane-1-carboxylate deaminase/D-cysteine desulfhydrase-like pyridoxal-dependent ACC family enzyme
MAQALAGNHDCVVTIGGIQSNHCRATAVAARYLGLDCHLILRTSRQAVDQDPSLVGNLLVERLAGAQLHMVTKEEYTRLGSQELTRRLAEQLTAAGRRPYVIPVGGSNALGSWGYLQAAEELAQQAALLGHAFDDIAMACGSGGTTAGLALGNRLSGFGARVHAYGVCDDPEYFYGFIDGILEGMGAGLEVVGAGAREMLTAVQAKGIGYALSKEEELRSVRVGGGGEGLVGLLLGYLVACAWLVRRGHAAPCLLGGLSPSQAQGVCCAVTPCDLSNWRCSHTSHSMCAPAAGHLAASPPHPCTINSLHACNHREPPFACRSVRISNHPPLPPAQDIAAATGVILDPVYSGKAAHYMIKDMQERPEEWRGRRVLFLHTGGLLGLYEKADQLQGLVEGQQQGGATRMQL